MYIWKKIGETSPHLVNIYTDFTLELKNLYQKYSICKVDDSFTCGLVLYLYVFQCELVMETNHA